MSKQYRYFLPLARRQFIKGLGSATGAVMFARAGTVWSQSAAGEVAAYTPRTLQSVELATLKAIMARLIPADAHSGGAVEARAYVYVDRALSGFHAQHLPTYRSGLATLNALAQKQGAASVETLSVTDRDTLIARLEAGTVTEPIELDKKTFTLLPEGGKALFTLILRHTIEGTFSDPMYGGNQQFIGWQLLGYAGVQFYFSEQAQAINGRQAYTNRSIADFGGKPLP